MDENPSTFKDDASQRSSTEESRRREGLESPARGTTPLGNTGTGDLRSGHSAVAPSREPHVDPDRHEPPVTEPERFEQFDGEVPTTAGGEPVDTSLTNADPG